MQTISDCFFNICAFHCDAALTKSIFETIEKDLVALLFRLVLNFDKSNILILIFRNDATVCECIKCKQMMTEATVDMYCYYLCIICI